MENFLKNLKIKFNQKEFAVLLPLLVKLYVIFLGISWIILHVYIRVFIERPSYLILELKPYITIKHYIIFSLFVIIHIVLILIAAWFLYKKNHNFKTNSMLINITSKLNNIITHLYWKPLEHIHDIVFPHIPGAGNFFLYIEKKWQTIGFTYLMLLFFEILPKFIVALIFIIEVIFYGRIYIFVHALILLVVPILFTIFIKFFYSFAIHNLPNFKEPYEQIQGFNPIYDADGQFERFDHYEFVLKDEYIGGVVDAEDDLKYILILEHIQDIVRYTKDLKENILPYITITTSSIYVVGGIIRLLILLL